MEDSKFRSLKAFKSFERETLGSGAKERAVEVSPLRVLAALKKHPEGVSVADLRVELGASGPAVETALVRLLKEEMVATKQGDAGDVFVLK